MSTRTIQKHAMLQCYSQTAKEGAIEVPPNQFTAIPFSVGKK
jgi:hypothetical protein